jgi:cinnamyl-alcohol dehydrogenase
MGQHVTVISSSNKKRAEAMDDLGADAYLVSSDAGAAAADSLDYVIDTVPVHHPLEPYLNLSLLKMDGKLVLLGVIGEPLSFVRVPDGDAGPQVHHGQLHWQRGRDRRDAAVLRRQKGSPRARIEVVKMGCVNEEALVERLERNDVRYRFVVDVAASGVEEALEPASDGAA